MLKHFDDMNDTIELNLDDKLSLKSKNKIYFDWFYVELFDFIAECNDYNSYGIVTLLGEKLFVEPNKYSNNTEGIQIMIDELENTFDHTIRTKQAQAYFNKNREENEKYKELMNKVGLTPINNKNTFFAGKLDSIKDMEKSSLVNSGITDEDIENHDSDNPVEELDYEYTALSKYAKQIWIEAGKYGNFYREVEGIPFLAISNNSPWDDDIRKVALNQEYLKLLGIDRDIDMEGPKR